MTQPAPSVRLPVLDRRRAGVLLHPTALPGERGALGAAARIFIDWLAEAGFSVWQLLPLGPVGADGSPYWVRSDCAISPALIDAAEVSDAPADAAGFEAYCAASRHWLDDYALFVALSREHGGAPWWDWPAPLRHRETAAIRRAQIAHAGWLRQCRLEQWQAHRQWHALRCYAHRRGVRLFGDLPIYVAPDSATVWAHRAQFQLDGTGRPLRVAGVPPDHFAIHGQLWGNPLYEWQQAERDSFALWRARLACPLERFDLVRIDHFRGLAAYWSVAAGAVDARGGQWMPAPGHALLAAMREQYRELPLVAEDLGMITPDVDALRHAFALPGMRVLQFGFDGSADNPHLPHNYERDTVAYTGTHDNDTALGWYGSLGAEVAGHVDAYLSADAADMPRSVVRATVASVAQLAVVPLQDLLALGSEARFNVPGTTSGNWRWRMEAAALTPALAAELRALNRLYGRLAE